MVRIGCRNPRGRGRYALFARDTRGGTLSVALYARGKMEGVRCVLESLEGMRCVR
jgi:hypothetical protein